MDRIEDLVLWKTLNKQIGNREQVYIRRKGFFILEANKNICRCIKGYYALPSGSKAEGMDLSGSDVDLMLIMKYITVEPKQFNQPSLSDFIMETKNVKPGFAKLILGLNKRTKDKLRTLASALMSIDNHLVYLSSSLFRDKFVELSRKHTKSNVLPHGPCATRIVNGTEYDTMVSLRCQVWPREAIEWTYRRRINNWPTHDLVKKLVEEGCLLVPVGNPLSREKDIEWRISFSLAEKILVHSMNHCQFLCYGLLKLYLKHVINLREDCKGLICSYFLKTALFYSIEEEDIVWDQHNILNCFWTCFKRLFKWIKQGFFPNYFIKTNNMIESKISGESQRRLIEHLQNLYTCGSETIIRIPVIYNAYKRIVTKPITDAALQKINEFRFDRELYTMISLFEKINFERVLIYIERIRLILSLELTSSVDYIFLKISLASLNTNLTPYLYKTIAMSDNSNKNKYQQIRQLSKHILRNCTRHDICSGLLQYATLNFLTRRYCKVVCILKDVLTKFEHFVFYRGKSVLQVTAVEYVNYMCGRGFKIEHKVRSAFAMAYRCLESCKFYPEEIEAAISKNKDQSDNVTYIPPKVYSYVLLFLTYHRTGNTKRKNQILDELCEATCDQHLITKSEKPVVSALFQRCVEIAKARIP